MDKTPGGVGASSLASTERRLKEALEELSEVEGLVDAISGACSEHFLADASQRMLLLAPQIRALATSTHVAHPSCLPLLEELKSRAAHVSQEYTRRSEQYKRSVLAPPEPSKKPTPPPVGQEGKKKSQVTPTQQDHGPIIVDDDEAAAAVAKRLRNMALFEQAVKKNVQRSEVRAKRKSIGVEFATSELKKAEKPVVDRDYPPPITPHTSKPQQLPFDASREFFAKGRLQLEQHLADGFYDLGFVGSQQATQGLPALEAVKTLSLGSGEEEVVLIDRRHDTRLAFLAAEAERFCGFIPDTELRTKMLSLFVSNAMGGSRIDNNHAPPLSQLHSEDVQRLVAKETNKNILAIGEMAHGGLRHRALLFKYLADLVGVASELVRSDDVPGVYWNIVELEKKRFLVDVMHRPATLHPLHSLTYYAYTRITPPATHPTSGTQLKPHAHESLLSYEPDALSSVTSSKPGVRAGYRWVLPQDLSRAQLVLLDKLGSGGCASVWRCKLGGFTCAVKIINTEAMSKSSRKRVMQEIELLQKLQHRNIVAFLGKEIMDKELHIFMELVPYSLFEIIQQVKKGLRPPFTPDEIITCITHMAKALMYLHGLPDKVIHRDCKSKNVLIELGSGHEAARIQKAKLCDFGVSKVVTESTQADTSIGTSRWMAPEVVAVLDGKRESYDEKSDVWALGMVLFEMLTYRLPYEEVGLLDVRDHVLKGHSPAFSGEVQEDYAPFLPLFYNCTKFKPEERYSAEQALLHLLRL